MELLIPDSWGSLLSELNTCHGKGRGHPCVGGRGVGQTLPAGVHVVKNLSMFSMRDILKDPGLPQFYQGPLSRERKFFFHPRSGMLVLGAAGPGRQAQAKTHGEEFSEVPWGGQQTTHPPFDRFVRGFIRFTEGYQEGGALSFVLPAASVAAMTGRHPLEVADDYLRTLQFFASHGARASTQILNGHIREDQPVNAEFGEMYPGLLRAARPRRRRASARRAA